MGCALSQRTVTFPSGNAVAGVRAAAAALRTPAGGQHARRVSRAL